VANGCSCGKNLGAVPDKEVCRDIGKHPRTADGFKAATTDQEQVRAWWDKWPDANIAIPTGARSGLLVVDSDPRHGGPEGRADLIDLVGPIPETAEAISGGDGRHVYFRYGGGPVPKLLAQGIDLKGDGGYVVAPPSLHKSGKRYEWDGIEGAKAILHPGEAPRWLLDFIRVKRTDSELRGAVDLPETIPDGQKHNAIVSLAGTLRRRGCTEEVAFAACRALKFESPVSDKEIRVRVEDVYRRYPAVEWPKPEPIQSELPPVQAFSEDLLPDSFRPLVRDVTERMQVPMDYPAVVMVLCLAGAVNRRAMIQPKERDTAWAEPANLWGAIIGPPGVMKTPVIQVATRQLVQIQTEWRKQCEGEMEEYDRAIEEWELTMSAWKEEFKASKKGSKKKLASAPERPPEAPERPKLRRLIVNDATFEALHKTMSENSAGVLLLRDEIVGWLAGLEKAGHETERAFCLEAWNGKNPYTVDRIGRGTIHVPACCMSLLGGIQPGRLRSYLIDAIQDGPSNDGLMQRFQMLVWPDLDTWEYVDRAPNAAAEEQAARIFRKLVELDAENPALFRFAPDAQELFIAWLAELEAKIRGDELHPALAAHLSKYRKLMPVLALLFELADRVSSVGFDGSSVADSQNFVSLEHTRLAAAWCEFLESHARRVYSCVVTSQLRAACELADKIKKKKVGGDGFFLCRDVYQKGWSSLDSPEAVKRAAEVLKDASWVREAKSDSGPSGGRPANRYEVNPRVWE
jgi:putative DNA primase/helicase